MDDFENEFENQANDEEEGASDISSELIRGHINTIILRTLIDGEKYGTEIIEDIEKKSNGLYSMKQPTLYSALKRLESQGYLTSYWGGVSTGGRRRYFSLTEEGLKAATKNINEWEHSRSIIDSLIGDEKQSPEPDEDPAAENRVVFDDTPMPEETAEPDAPAPEDVAEPEEKTLSEEPKALSEEEVREREKSFRLLFSRQEESEPAIRRESPSQPAYRQKNADEFAMQEPMYSKPRQRRDASFTDDDYHRIRRQSRFDGEYRSIIDSIYESADTASSEESKRFEELHQEDFNRPILRKKILKEAQEVYEEQDMAFKGASYNAFERYSAMTGQPAVKANVEPKEEPVTFIQADEPTVSVKKMKRDGTQIPDPVEEEKEEPSQPAIVPPEPSDYAAEENDKPDMFIDENDDDINIDFSEIRKAARDERIKIYFASGEPIKKKIPDVTFNMGATLFKSSVVILLLSLIEALPVFLLMKTLNVSFAYPLTMVLIPLFATILFGLLSTFKFGYKKRKNIPMQYFTTAVIVFVVAVLAIASFAIFKEFSLSSLPEIFKYILIPCIYSFNIVIFAAVYYTFVKQKNACFSFKTR